MSNQLKRAMRTLFAICGISFVTTVIYKYTPVNSYISEYLKTKDQSREDSEEVVEPSESTIEPVEPVTKSATEKTVEFTNKPTANEIEESASELTEPTLTLSSEPEPQVPANNPEPSVEIPVQSAMPTTDLTIHPAETLADALISYSEDVIPPADDQDYNYESDGSEIKYIEKPSARRNPQSGNAVAKPSVNIKARVDDQNVSLARYSRVDLEFSLAGSSSRDLNNKDKSDRATTELVMDPKTRMILFKMTQRGIFSEVNGAVSTGKEANVYDAVLYPENPNDEDARPVHKAVKIYKTSILVFKDRERYIAGEHRFSKGADKGNSHKMVKLWAEKEFRNLKRIHAAGIPSPEPIALKNNVLVMSFLGDRKGWAYPRLRDAPIETEETWQAMYVQLVGLMRTMYQECRLIHADLSEYNVLYHKDKLYIIDVSQSVEPDHPHSLEFLRMDIKNISDFFMRKNVETLKDRTAFDFISHAAGPLDTEGVAKAVNELIERQISEEESGNAAEREVDNAVFRQQYIPQNLEQVIDVETDIAKIGEGKGEDLVYKNLLADMVIASDNEKESEEGEERDEEIKYCEFFDEEKERPRGKKHQDKTEKKAHKMAVKEAKRDKRATKMSKYEKKKAIAASSRKK